MSMKNRHSWDAAVMLRLLSKERMDTYLAATNENLNDAFALYSRNIRIACALQAMTAMVEVVVRNSIDYALTAWYEDKNPGADWFDLEILDERAKRDIAAARQRVQRSCKPETHSKILPELSFGFWRFLTSKRYLTTLWMPALQYAFPHGHKDIWTRQKQVSAMLGNMTFIRNRAAHLEPVFRRKFTNDIAEARRLMRWIDPDAALWFEETLKFDSIFAAEPNLCVVPSGITSSSSARSQ